MQHPIFWFLLGICRCMRGPLRHFFCFVQQQAQNCNSGQVMLQLVTGKLEEIQAEYLSILANLNRIIETALDMSGSSDFFKNDQPGRAALSLIAWKLCFQQWASFQRRIYYPLLQQLAFSNQSRVFQINHCLCFASGLVMNASC